MITNSDRPEPGLRPVISGAHRATIIRHGGDPIVTTWADLTAQQVGMANLDPARLDRHLTEHWHNLLLLAAVEPAVRVDTTTGSAVIPPIGHIIDVDIEVRLRREPNLSHITIRVEHVT